MPEGRLPQTHNPNVLTRESTRRILTEGRSTNNQPVLSQAAKVTRDEHREPPRLEEAEGDTSVKGDAGSRPGPRTGRGTLVWQPWSLNHTRVVANGDESM